MCPFIPDPALPGHATQSVHKKGSHTQLPCSSQLAGCCCSKVHDYYTMEDCISCRHSCQFRREQGLAVDFLQGFVASTRNGMLDCGCWIAARLYFMHAHLLTWVGAIARKSYHFIPAGPGSIQMQQHCITCMHTCWPRRGQGPGGRPYDHSLSFVASEVMVILRWRKAAQQ